MVILIAVAALFIGGNAVGFEVGKDNPGAGNFFEHVHDINSAS